MRVKSTAVWHSLSGVICAYQSIGAPTAVDALLNVAHDHRSVGFKTLYASSISAPSWTPTMGWYHNGTALWTGVVPNPAQSVLCRFSNQTGGWFCGGADGNQMALRFRSADGLLHLYNGSEVTTANITAGVLAVAGPIGYKNGVEVGSGLSQSFTPNGIIIIGGYWNGTMPVAGIGYVQAAVVCARTLTPAEVWLASRQMAYCEQNPDWNAWSRRRRYYYAPSAAAGRVGIYGRRGAVALPDGVRIGTVNDA